MSISCGIVSLVGAGCGQADLITVRGRDLLRRCQVVVYDDLIDPALLEEAPSDAVRIYMGKRRGSHSASQEEICAVLIKHARAGKQVVRLKGGDPFVFGRGGEEVLALQAAGIPWEIVPGISSALAIPALAGIPVTHRGISQSVHIITAHTAGTADGLPACFDALAGLDGTLVFLMGLSQLSNIICRLKAAGKPDTTPAAVISGGNAPYPAIVRGTLADLEQQVQKAGLLPPAVIVVGPTATLALTSMSLPLAGIQVGLTGTKAMTDKLAAGLRQYGAQVFLAARSVVRELPLSYDLSTLGDGKSRWLVLTSANGVNLFFQAARRQKLDLRRLAACRFAAIGPATAAVLAEYGIQADLCPALSTTQALGEALCQAVPPGMEILLFRSLLGSKPLARLLAAQHPVQDIPLYTLEQDIQLAAAAHQRLSTTRYLVFSSASGVDLFFQAHGPIPVGAVCVCIGEVTASALKERYTGPMYTAPEISATGIVQAILDHRASTTPV
ncbi:MAG: uroporphyrinogen-III C-methyltransferase [Oscillospiraceae bacterium]|nr:uroporphyrinogen-III C-methyltransferase [Oscillospiraceae bacterium]